MPAALCAFDVYGTLLADGMLPDAPRGTAVEMANGRCSMIFGRAWTLAWLRTTEVAGRIAVAPMPQGPGGGGAPAEAYVYVVRRGAPPVAWELVRWLVSGESYARFVSRTGAVPLTRAVSADTLDEALATYLAQGGIVFPEVDLDGGWEIIGEALRDYIGRAPDFEEFVDPAPSPS